MLPTTPGPRAFAEDRGDRGSRIRDEPNLAPPLHFEVTAADRSSGSLNRLEIRSYVD